MKLGMYRVNDPFLGECAKVKWYAGDGAPYLQRELYDLLRFEPKFDMLPDLNPPEADIRGN